MEDISHSDDFFLLDTDTLVQLIRSAGMSVRSFSLAVDMTQTGFTAALKRGSLDTRTLLRCADVLKMTPTDLLFRLMPADLRQHFGMHNSYSQARPLSMVADGSGLMLTDEDLRTFFRVNSPAIQKLLDREMNRER